MQDPDSKLWAAQESQKTIQVPAYLKDLVEHQSMQLRDLLIGQCLVKNNEPDEEPHCVVLMPHDNFSEFAHEKQLILSFTKVSDYPKRTINSSKWDFSIPNPIDGLDWCTHFENLRFTKGPWYARVIWSDTGHRSGAYVASEAEGDRLCSLIEGLSKSTPKRRRITRSGRTMSGSEVRVILGVLVEVVNGEIEKMCFRPPIAGC